MKGARAILVVLLLVTVCATGLAGPALAGPTAARPRWVQRLDDLVAGRPVSVSIGYDGTTLYRKRHLIRRAPASNQKLLLSMALLDRLGPGATIRTHAFAARGIGADGILRGNLWLVGSGDPEGGPRDAKEMARALRDAGLERIRGRVLGAKGPFRRDWFAEGWRSYFPTSYIALPTALTYRSNRGPNGAMVRDPERRAAAALTKQLRARGVRVRRPARAGHAPAGMTALATIRSAPLSRIVRRMNVPSNNFRAEVLGKLLGARVRGAPGSIAKGAKATEAFLDGVGIATEAKDSSGLSYANRVSTRAIVRALWAADDAPWGRALRATLPRAGQGTLEDRLGGVRVRAKTGTLEGISALSGWVWLRREDAWAQFSILSRGLSKTEAIRIENTIVRVVGANAGPR